MLNYWDFRGTKMCRVIEKVSLDGESRPSYLSQLLGTPLRELSACGGDSSTADLALPHYMKRLSLTSSAPPSSHATAVGPFGFFVLELA